MWLFNPNKVWREVMTPRRVCYIWSHLMNLHTFLQSRVTLRNPIAVICLPSFSLTPQRRIYMISMGSMVIGSNMLQSHLLSTTTMKRLLLGICWITKDLPNRKRKKERWKRKREQETVESEIWLAVQEHGYDVNFHVCHGICVMSLHMLPWQRGEGLWRDSTGCMSRVWSISPPAVNKHTATQTDSHQRTHTHSLHTYLSNSLHPPLFLVLFLSFS